MSDFKAKMHQIVCRLGLCPRPRWGSLQRSPRPLAGFRGPTSKGRGREGEGKVGKEKGGNMEGVGRGGWGGRGQCRPPPKLKLGFPRTIFLAPALLQRGGGTNMNTNNRQNGDTKKHENENSDKMSMNHRIMRL